MEKPKKKLTISGKPKKTFVPQQNFESKKKFFSNDKKFSKTLNKNSGNFKKNFKTKPLATKLSDYDRVIIRILARYTLWPGHGPG